MLAQLDLVPPLLLAKKTPLSHWPVRDLFDSVQPRGSVPTGTGIKGWLLLVLWQFHCLALESTCS